MSLTQYAQLAIQAKNPVALATAAPLSVVTPGVFVYADGAAGVGATLTAPGVGLLSIDGVACSAPSATTGPQRVLVQNEAAPQHDGIYLVNNQGGPAAVALLTRALDANQPSADGSGSGALTGALVLVLAGGATQGGRLRYQSAVIVTTAGTAQVWTTPPGAGGQPTTADKNLASLAVPMIVGAPGNRAVTAGITFTPANGSYIAVYRNGVLALLGDGVTTGDFYFSSVASAGAAARAIAAIQATDQLYCGTGLAFPLLAGERIDWLYNV